jgi:hypothetical protein
MKRIFLAIILSIILIFPICSASHYVEGFVKDALDGQNAENRTIILWNPLNGINDNLTDLIGEYGNSGRDNYYQIDCHLLINNCSQGDVLSLKVLDNGDNYVSEEINITIGSSSPNYSENITLNSPPNTSLIYPINFANISNSQIEFNCSASDFDENLKEISLYGNWTGEWSINETKSIGLNENSVTFNKTIPQGFYIYGCKATDNLSISSFSYQNNSFKVDLTNPTISSIMANLSYSCGTSNQIRVNCTSYDDFSGIDKIIIQAISPLGDKEYIASLLTEDTYYADLQLNEMGSWKFNCIANDSAGNSRNLTSDEVKVYSDLPDLYINFSSIKLSYLFPIENQTINISAIFQNLGCGYAENRVVSFFNGNPLNHGKSIGNITTNISGISFIELNIPWNAEIGLNNIFVFADYNFSINEENESNNYANNTFSINSWQEIYGNASIDKIVGNNISNMKKWFNESYITGNIFAADSECSINWLSLQAIGRLKNGGISTDDFLEIDDLLNTKEFNDSISNVFSDNQIPKQTSNLIIHQKEIQEVPIINSTNNSNFVTGILWDSSDDTNGEFDLADKEDLVFVAPINKQKEGAYGIYDYELKIPAKLREYNSLDSEEIYLYYDLN